MKLQKELRLLSLAIISPFILVGQMLWPGDINDNGVVNGIDVLYAGVAYGSTGPPRPGANENWEAQAVGDFWSQIFFDGINYAYADCDGNGVIEENDIEETIKDNFFLTHGTLTPDEYSSGTPGSSPIVSLSPQVVNVGVGATVIFDLLLGTAEIPVQNFYGIAISMNYNPDFTLGSEWEFEGDENAWYDPSDEDAKKLLVVDESAGKMELAITRTNQQSINGGGKIGEFTIVVEDIVFGLMTDTLFLEIESIRMIDKDFNTLSVVSDSTFVVISRPTTTNEPAIGNGISVFPNPAKGYFTIAANEDLLGYEIREMTGEVAYRSAQIPFDTRTIHVPIIATKLRPQLYLLMVHTTAGTIVEKLILI